MSDLFDREAEAAVLGAMLISEKAIDAVSDSGLSVDDFHSPAAGHIFAAIERCAKAGSVDEALVVADLAQRKGDNGNLLEQVGGQTFIYSLTQRVPAIASAKRYAETVLDYADRRRLVKACDEIKGRAESPEGSSIGDLVAEAANLVSSVQSEAHSSGFVTVDQVARRMFDEEWNSTERVAPGISSGFKAFDAINGGLRPATLTIIAARPAMGKSAWLANVLDNITEAGKNVALFSLEMEPPEVVGRILSRRSKIANKRLSRMQLSDVDRKQVESNVADLEINLAGRFHISTASALSHQRLRALARSLDRRLRVTTGEGLACLGVDYLQLMTAPEMQRGNREGEVAKISRELKALSRELHIPVIALSQLSRAVEGRGEKRPMLSDLRESGSIEQDADTVGFMYRHEYYHPDDAPSKGLAELIVAKNRAGETGTIHLGWRAAYTAFIDLADVHKPGFIAGTRQGAVA